MRVLSVEDIGLDPALRLLENGAFDAWYGGMDAPSGFMAPANPEISTLKRGVRSGHLNTPGYTARQTWHTSGVLPPPGERFHTVVELAPTTQYAFSAVATATPGMRAGVGAYERDADGRFRVLARNVIAVAGEEPARYSGTFETVDGGPVVLASHAWVETKMPGSVTWSSWALAPAAEALPPAAVTEEPARRMLMHAALEQVRGQVALYGGHERWAEEVEPIAKNVGRIYREAGESEYNSVLGYEGHVFQKPALEYFAGTHGYAEPPGGDANAAYAAILRAERALAARGIHFAVVPVPARIRLYTGMLFKPAREAPVPLNLHAGLVERLLRDDVLVLDPGPLLWRLRSAGKPVYWRADHDIPSFTLQAIAEMAAAPVEKLLGDISEVAGQEYTVTVNTMPLNQRLVPEIMPAQRESIAGEERRIYSVRDSSGEVLTPAAGSPLLVAGSYALAHQVRGASLAAHLSHELGFSVAIPAKRLPDSEIPAYLSADPPELEQVRAVVFCFPEESLVQDGWK